MSSEHENPSSTEAIRKRAEELAGSGDELTGEAELLAALADASITFEEIDEAALERCIAAFGTEAAVEALIEASALSREEVNGSAPIQTAEWPVERRGFGAWLQAWTRRFAGAPGGGLAWAALAILIVGVFLFYETGHKAGQKLLAPGLAERENSLKLQWPSRAPFDPSTVRTWVAPSTDLAETAPDFNKGIATLSGGGDDRYERWQMATVIVRSGNDWEHGWGSGALISGEGWILSSYRVVADAAQHAAISGRPAKVDVITARLADGRIQPRAAVKATLFRADPARDLALLKIDSLPVGEMAVPFFRFGTRVRRGENCFVIGSEPKGPAWWVRSGNVSESQDASIAPVLAGGAFARVLTAWNATDIRVSTGDSGGPLLNAEGKLIGLTLPQTDSRGEGRHVALQELVKFIRDLPTQPEGVPFDPWMAGLPEAAMLKPELAESAHRGSPDALVYRYSSQVAAGAKPASPQAEAVIVFADLSGHKINVRESGSSIPFGLWGMENRGGFRFDVFVMLRADHLVAVGYTGPDEVVDEILVGNSADQATLVWSRHAGGKWYAAEPSNPIPLIDTARLGKDGMAQLRVILDRSLTGDVAY